MANNENPVTGATVVVTEAAIVVATGVLVAGAAPEAVAAVTEAVAAVTEAVAAVTEAAIEDHAQTDPSAQNVPTVQVAMTKASENVAPDVLPVVMMVAADDRIRPVAAKLSK